MFGRAQLKTREEVERRVAELGWWYHHFELPSGVWTGDGQPPAYCPADRWALIAPHLPDDLSGKSVVDVGGNSGYFSVQMKLRGAARCVMVEPVRDFVDQAKFVASQFGVRIEVVNDDVHAYCLTTSERFDYVLFLGLFYHLKYPVLVLDRLAEMTKTLMFFNSHIEGPPTSESDGAGKPADLDREDLAAGTFPRLSFIEGAYRGDLSNWWIPNYQALEPLARSAGLRVVARPHPEMLVLEPMRHLGTARYRRLVFPRYGKSGGAIFPGSPRNRL
ncbi:MAG: class I SAM-dependent methyltransferase [Gaiellaceae bacterium]